MPNILCGPIFEDLPANHQEKAVILRNAEETFRRFYKMVEGILTLKEIEERTRQTAIAADDGWTPERDIESSGLRPPQEDESQK